MALALGLGMSLLCLPASSLASSSPIGSGFPDVITADVARFTRMLSSPVPERRVEGLQGLADLKHWPAESAVLRLLEDSFPTVRRESVLALSRLGSARSIPPFIDLLGDSSWDIRQNAWLSLRTMTMQDFGSMDRNAWKQWWDASPFREKEWVLLSNAGRPPAVAVGRGTNAVVHAAFASSAPGRPGRARARLRPPIHPERHDALRALARIATTSSEEALLQLLRDPQKPPLDVDERNFVCMALERVGSPAAVPVLAAQRSDAAAWALGNIGGAAAEQALLSFPRTLPVLLALDRLHSTNAAPFISQLVAQMGQITYRSQPDDVMNEDLQPIQRVGANLIRRSGLAEVFIESVMQELEDTMNPPIAHGPRPAHPPEWSGMFTRMRSELKPGFVREDGTTTSQPIVAMCYLFGGAGEGKDVVDTRLQSVATRRHLVRGSGKPDAALVQRLIPLLGHPAVVPRVYVALALGRMQATDALRPMTELIREGYPFSDSTALASGKHFDQSQAVRWRGFVCLALGRMGGDEARRVLEEFASDPKQSRDVRYSAVVGLGFIGSPASIPMLERISSDDIIWLVRDEARRVAQQINMLAAEHTLAEVRP